MVILMNESMKSVCKRKEVSRKQDQQYVYKSMADVEARMSTTIFSPNVSLSTIDRHVHPPRFEFRLSHHSCSFQKILALGTSASNP